MVGRGSAADVTGKTKLIIQDRKIVGGGEEIHGGPDYLQLVGSRRLSTELGDLIESVNKTEKRPLKFDYSIDADGHQSSIYCRSDHYSYARYGIPITFFTTGGHSDYHQLTDEPEYIDYEHMARVATLVKDIATSVANLDHRIVVDKPKPDPKGQWGSGLWEWAPSSLVHSQAVMDPDPAGSPRNGTNDHQQDSGMASTSDRRRGECRRSAHARVWAPRRKSVELVTFGEDGAAGRVVPLEREDGGFFSACAPGVKAGTRYRYRLDGGDAFPDPASRYQPDGPHGPSQVVDPTTFNWTDAGWRGISRAGQIISEIHIGTFTPEGTFRAATAKLDALADVGITAIEIMPIADFPGKFGWGYDGVNLYAPTRLYGTPDDLRALVDAAHARGLGVILDVVYNHLGPDGNYLTQFSDRYVGKKPTEWGDSLNFDGEDSGPVRELVVRNAEYWITEFHLDGLRLDATQQIYDDSDRHIIADVVAAARAAAGEREILVVGENEPQDTRLIRSPETGGYGVDALWNDDFHHAAFVAMTGKAEAYYSDYRGTPQEFVSAAKHGFLYQGQYYAWQKDRRGTPALDFGPTSFVNFLESHDQVANLSRSRRVHQLTSPALFRAMTALLLLSPQTPMLFQGEEWNASSPFPFLPDTPEIWRAWFARVERRS